MNTQEKLDLINKELNICYLSLDEVDWSFISECQKLSEGFIREFQDFVDWECISKHQKLSESFIREFQGRVDWCYISAHQKLSEEFIREFQGTVYWRYISKYQKLSGSFIREYEDFVDWINISKYQNLSENFIREFQDFVDWDCISAYQKLSESFIREFEDKLNKELINDNWSYKDTGFLKERGPVCTNATTITSSRTRGSDPTDAQDIISNTGTCPGRHTSRFAIVLPTKIPLAFPYGLKRKQPNIATSSW